MRTTQLVSLLCLIVTPAFAQDVPSNESLSSVGLERAWVSQARVDPSRGRLTHISVDERYLYAQASNGSITAFDAETGNRQWVVQLGPPDRTTFAAVSNADLVLVVTGMTVFGVEKSSGHIVWTAKMSASASTSAVLDDDAFYVGTTDGSVYAFNMAVVAYKEKTGRLPGSFDPSTKQVTSPVGPVAASNLWMWRYRTGRSLNRPPIMTGGSVLIGDSSGQIYGVTAGTPEELGGKLTFQFQAGKGSAGSMVAKDGIIYMATGDNRVVAVNAKQGQIVWRYSVGHRILGSPVLVGDRIYLSTESEGLIALDVESGTQVTTKNGPWWIPGGVDMVAATKSMIFASDRQGNLISADRKTGSRRGQIALIPFRKRIHNDLNDRLYVASHQGLIMCLREIGSEEPTFYRNADRTPITPVLTGDDEPVALDSAESEATP